MSPLGARAFSWLIIDLNAARQALEARISGNVLYRML